MKGSSDGSEYYSRGPDWRVGLEQQSWAACPARYGRLLVGNRGECIIPSLQNPGLSAQERFTRFCLGSHLLPSDRRRSPLVKGLRPKPLYTF
jgi:hypothetical protein